MVNKIESGLCEVLGAEFRTRFLGRVEELSEFHDFTDFSTRAEFGAKSTEFLSLRSLERVPSQRFRRAYVAYAITAGRKSKTGMK